MVCCCRPNLKHSKPLHRASVLPLAAIVACLPSAVSAAVPKSAGPVRLVTVETWAPHPTAAAVCSKAEGGQVAIEGNVRREDGYRLWNGGDFREVTFQLRRPHLYKAFSEEANFGPLTRPDARP